MREKIVAYELISVTGHNERYNIELSRLVRQMIDKGWQPYGPPFYGGDGMNQAMVKFSDEQVQESS